MLVMMMMMMMMMMVVVAMQSDAEGDESNAVEQDAYGGLAADKCGADCCR